MQQRVNLNKNVFSKEGFNKTVNTSFTQLVTPEVVPTASFTVNDFFIQYENLFYEIPKEGETNSHQYLIQKSSDYANFAQNNEEIEALLEEIAQLRQDNLDLNQSLTDLSRNIK